MSKKSLPIVSAPTMMVELPVSKRKVKYRPFVIKEQKALLLAQESNDADTVMETIKSVIHSCTNGTMEFDKVPTADLSYFFLQLRIASVGPDVRFSIKCESCGHPNTIGMSLQDVKVDDQNIITDIKITPDVGVKFRLPTVEDAFNAEKSEDRSIKMLYELIEYIYDEDQVYQKSDYTEEEFKDWIESLSEQQIQKFSDFSGSIPELRHTLTFNCTECNHTQSRLLEGLHNFFRFGDDT